MKICISSGHGKYIRGAAGPEPWGLDEVDEARICVEKIADYLRAAGVTVETYHDDVSHSQDENLNRIVSWHNSQGPRDYDISCHFNAYTVTSGERGVEVYYGSPASMADKVSAAIASAADFIDRGHKSGGGLYFINNTSEPALLLEICFVDAQGDCEKYNANVDQICEAIAATLAGKEIPDEVPPTEPELPPAETGDNSVAITGTTQGDVSIYINGTLIKGHEPCEHVIKLNITMHGDVTLTIQGEEFHNAPPFLFEAAGTCSWFGGPEDMGVSPSEGLAFIYSYDQAPHLFLDYQPSGTSGLARRLDTEGVYYVACRWDYDVTPKTMLDDKNLMARVRANGREFLAWPADWGPHEEQTGRAADLSHALMEALGITTDDHVEVAYPVEV